MEPRRWLLFSLWLDLVHTGYSMSIRHSGRCTSLLLIQCLFLLSCGSEDNASETEQQDPLPVNVSVYGQSGNQLSRKLLERSLELGTSFLLQNQKEQGNFQYEYNFVKRRYNTRDSQVRQAGALWGLSLIHQNKPSEATSDALVKGFEFFLEHSRETREGALYIVYPGEGAGRSGTVALMALALIDFLRSDDSIAEHPEYEAALVKCLDFLISLRQANGHFSKSYDYETGWGDGSPSPYFDGEILLALVKARNYLGFRQWDELLLESAEAMYLSHVDLARSRDPDSNTTKGFYQWGSMAYFEIYKSDLPADKEKYAEWVIDLAYWMINEHRTLKRRRNTAYAYEGMICAWELARLTGNAEALRMIGDVINDGLYKLTSWQVGSPNQNAFLLKNRTNDPRAIGGVMNHRREAPLRIDVCQHQMHAVILAARYVYQE